VADFHTSAESGHEFLVNFFSFKKAAIVLEVSEKPSQFPNRPPCAIDTGAYARTCKLCRFKHGKPEKIERSLRVPVVLRRVDADQKDSFR